MFGELVDAEQRANGKLLAIGVNGTARAEAAALPTLHHAELEAREVFERWPSSRATLRTGEAAGWSQLDPAELADFSVIHLASHALLYRGAADQTTLLMAGAGEEPVTSRMICGLDLSADLIYLSCCEAAEDFGRGFGPAHAGLVRCFLAAGARAVVATTIKIDDEAARYLAGRFYDHWLSGASVAEALREAQLALRDGDEGWLHPYYWAFYEAIQTPQTAGAG
jgi:CHAT domain-containing protein